METCRSPLEVLRRAYEFGSRVWTDHASLFSRKDFTRPQLFACLVLREWLRLSYRKTEAFLTDVPAWLSELGMTHAPDHNTLWRAFGSMFTAGDMRKVLDLMAEDARVELKIGLKAKPLTMDSTCYEPRHRSAHYDRACRKIDLKAGTKYAKRPGKHGPAVNRSRSRRVKAMPKLAIAISAANHQILAGLRAPAVRRMAPRGGQDRRGGRKTRRVRRAPGYDSEDNHRLARLDMGVRSVIRDKIGRPAKEPAKTRPTGCYRRLMKQRFERKADAKTYGQRAQSETVNSMMKRNLGQNLRSITPERRKNEMSLRSIVHNLILGPDERAGRD